RHVAQLVGLEPDAKTFLDRDHNADVSDDVPIVDVAGLRRPREGDAIVVQRVPNDVRQASQNLSFVHRGLSFVPEFGEHTVRLMRVKAWRLTSQPNSV